MIGLHIIPNFNPASIPAIKSSLPPNPDIITNYKIGLPHTFIKFSDEPQTVYGSTDTHVPTKETSMDLTDPFQKQLALLEEIVKRSDKLILVFPDQTKVSHLLVMLAKSKLPTRVIVQDQILTPQEVENLLANSDKELLKKQYEEIYRPVVKRLYEDHQLIRTPNGCVLRQYQQQMVDFAIENRRVGLFVDMGLGKTLATLATINELAKKGQLDTTKPILIIAPITVALDTWVREAEKWGYDMDVVVNIGLSVKKRNALLEELLKPKEKITLVTTNPHQLDAIYKFFKSKRKPAPFQMVIVDELSMFKNIDATRTKVLISNTKSVDYFIGLTGTPAPNTLLDVYSQLLLISPENQRIFGKNFYTYRETFFEPAWTAPDGRVYSYKLKHGADQTIYNKMKKTVISMRSVGLVDLPTITYTNLYVTLPPKAKKMYDEMVSNFDSEYGSTINLEDVTSSLGRNAEDEDEIEIANSAVLTGKLLQLSSGAIYKDLFSPESKSKEYKTFHDEKFKALKDIVENATSPILLFYQFRSDFDRLKDYIEFEWLNPKDKNFTETIARWNRGEIPVLAAYPGSAGHGLNLQDGGHTIVWLTPTWSNEVYRQANKRLHRSGQKNPVSVIHLIAKGTKDEDVIEALTTKEESQDALMEALDVAERP